MSYEESRRRVALLHQTLAQGESLTDDEVLAQLENLYIITNTLSAAELLVALLAPVCGYRPHLTDVLLPRILNPLWMTGFGTLRVIQWLEYHLSQAKPFGGLASPGLEWVQSLLHQHDRITQMLRRIKKQEKELNQRWEILRAQHQLNLTNARHQLAGYSQIAIEKIIFSSYWSQKYALHFSASVYFLYRDETMVNAFQLLTTAIAPYHEKMPFYVLTEANIEEIGKDYPAEVATWLENDQDPVWVVWFAQRKPRYICRASETSAKLYLQYTQAVLQSS
jgi:hypothetical protein